MNKKQIIMISKSGKVRKDVKSGRKCYFGMYVIKEQIGKRKDGTPVFDSVTVHKPIR